LVFAGAAIGCGDDQRAQRSRRFVALVRKFGVSARPFEQHQSRFPEEECFVTSNFRASLTAMLIAICGLFVPSADLHARVTVEEVREYLVSRPLLPAAQRTSAMISMVERLESTDPAEVILELSLMLVDNIYLQQKSAPKLVPLLSHGLALALESRDHVRAESYALRKAFHARGVDAYSLATREVAESAWETIERQRLAFAGGESSESDRIRHFVDITLVFWATEKQRDTVRFVRWAKYAVELTRELPSDIWFLSVEAKRQLALTYAAVGAHDRSVQLLQSCLELSSPYKETSRTPLALQWALAFVLTGSGDYEGAHRALAPVLSSRTKYTGGAVKILAHLLLQGVEINVKRDVWTDVEGMLREVDSVLPADELALRARLDAYSALWSIHVGDLRQAERKLASLDAYLNTLEDRESGELRRVWHEGKLRIASLGGNRWETMKSVKAMLERRLQTFVDDGERLDAVAEVIRIDEKRNLAAIEQRDRASAELSVWENDSRRRVLVTLSVVAFFTFVAALFCWAVRSKVRKHV
jgi:hypothetical protein